MGYPRRTGAHRDRTPRRRRGNRRRRATRSRQRRSRATREHARYRHRGFVARTARRYSSVALPAGKSVSRQPHLAPAWIAKTFFALCSRPRRAWSTFRGANVRNAKPTSRERRPPRRASCVRSTRRTCAARRAASRRACEPILRSRISAARRVALFASMAAVPARAATPSVAALDAAARASGNRRDVATHIGDTLFRTAMGGRSESNIRQRRGSSSRRRRTYVGREVSSAAYATKPLSTKWSALSAKRSQPRRKPKRSICGPAFRSSVGKGAVVSGDLAQPDFANGFRADRDTRRERCRTSRTRAVGGDNVYWDPQWVRTALVGAERLP